MDPGQEVALSAENDERFLDDKDWPPHLLLVVRAHGLAVQESGMRSSPACTMPGTGQRAQGAHRIVGLDVSQKNAVRIKTRSFDEGGR